MIRFLAVRLAQMALVMLAVMTLVFVLLRVGGDPAVVLAGPSPSPAIVEATRERLGLDAPILVQYKDFLIDIVRLDFGTSYAGGEPAFGMLLGALPRSLKIAIPSLLISVTVALVVGLIAALRNGRLLSRLLMLTAFTGQSVPYFWIAYLLILTVAVKWGWLPASGSDGWKSAILPVISITVPQVSLLARLVRGQMLDVLSQQYVVTARSLGLPAWRVLFQAFPNALTPVIAWIGLLAGNFLAMLIIVEPIFNYAGMGGLMIRSVTSRDFTVVLAGVFVLSAVTVMANLLADLAVRILDPRLRTKTS